VTAKVGKASERDGDERGETCFFLFAVVVVVAAAAAVVVVFILFIGP
jgi:hypothetical protein